MAERDKGRYVTQSERGGVPDPGADRMVLWLSGPGAGCGCLLTMPLFFLVSMSLAVTSETADSPILFILAVFLFPIIPGILIAWVGERYTPRRRLERAGGLFYDEPGVGLCFRAPESGLSRAELILLDRVVQLRSLCLARSPIADADLVHLRPLEELRGLDLSETLVTDAVFERLEPLTALEWLDLRGALVTAEGVAAFRASRPGMRTIWQDDTPGNSDEFDTPDEISEEL